MRATFLNVPFDVVTYELGQKMSLNGLRLHK